MGVGLAALLEMCESIACVQLAWSPHCAKLNCAVELAPVDDD